MNVRERRGGIWFVLLGALAGVALFISASPTARYLTRGAWNEMKILHRRKAISSLIADSTVSPVIRAKLRIVQAARAFAVDSLGLPARDAFTQFTQLDRDTLVLVLSAAYPDRLEAYTWWFPVVGRVPYKGFFDFESAKREERRFAEEGFDTYLRPSPAFSTLGWFNDPLLSTTLGEDSLFVAETVIHELTHNRIYLNGQAVFNESLADFVGARGAAEFFALRGDTAHARIAAERWHDDMLLAAAWERAWNAVDSAFRLHPGDSARAARIAARDTVYANVRRYLVDSVGPRLRTIDRRYVERVRLDNAALLARRIYATRLDVFDSVWEREGHSVKRALERLIALAQAQPGAPLDAVRAWLQSP